MQVPLFPLNVVLFPGGPLPLRIFESRYIDMIGERMRNNGPFGVLLIREGVESGGEASTWNIGTLAKIVDWYQGSDGLLGDHRDGRASAFVCWMSTVSGGWSQPGRYD